MLGRNYFSYQNDDLTVIVNDNFNQSVKEFCRKFKLSGVTRELKNRSGFLSRAERRKKKDMLSRK